MHVSYVRMLADDGNKDQLAKGFGIAEKELLGDIAIYPRQARCRSQLALIYCFAGVKYKEALVFAQQAKDYDPKVGDSILGFCYEKNGYYDLAIETYKKALSINSIDLDSWWRLGVVLQRQGRHEEAIGAWKTGLKIDPNYRFILKEMKSSEGHG